jgi:predicted phosphodiesterase
MKRKTIYKDVVRDYLIKHPDLPKQTIARLMMKEQPGLFATLEQARSAVRLNTGAHGKKNRMEASDKDLFRPLGRSGDDSWKSLMPESWAEPIEPFVLPSSIKKLLVFSDIHVPFHDINSLTVAIEYGMAENVDAVLLNGDTLDFYAISDHEKDPRKINWLGELEASRSVLGMMRKAFPNIPIYFKEGNHEYRLERHLMKHAPILIGMQEFELPVLLKMGEMGVEYIRNKRIIRAGGLIIGHGDEYRGSGGVNPARWISLRAGESMLIGHFHRVSEHIDKSISGSVRGYWSVGCLCELQPAYLPYNQWSHGFAIVHINNDNTFEVETMQVIEGRVR